MPRFFIDTADGDDVVRDEVGHELPDPKRARIMALDALPDMARDSIPDGDCRTFAVSIRNADGKVIYHASLALSGGWA